MKPKVSNINVEQWTANRAVCAPSLVTCAAGKEKTSSMPSLLETLRAAAAAAEEKVCPSSSVLMSRQSHTASLSCCHRVWLSWDLQAYIV